MTIAIQLGEFAASIVSDGLPSERRSTTAARLLDLIGNSLGALDSDPARIVLGVAKGWGGFGTSTAIGISQRLPAPSVALINGTLAHALDFDDTHLPSILHPSAPVIPAALAVAEQVGASGAATLDAIAVGVEVTCRLGMAGYDKDVRSSLFFDRGQHATAICGTVGAAIAAGMLRGLTSDALTSAIGIACSMGSGVLEANRTGGTVKRVHCGWAAHAGVVGAELAGQGMTGPPTVIEGRFGFFRAFCGERANVDDVVPSVDGLWESDRIFIKPYPCNHFTHAGIDAAIILRRDGLDPNTVVNLRLGVGAPAIRTIGEPRAEKARPRTGYHGAFSGPYTVAAALLGGGGLGLSHEDFTDEAVKDSARLRLAQCTSVYADSRCTKIFPNQFPAVLTATLIDGSTKTAEVFFNRGGPENPLSSEELAKKFALNVKRAVDHVRADRIVNQVWELAKSPTIIALTRELGFDVGF